MARTPKSFDELASEHGTVEHEGKTLALYQDAYPTSDSDRHHELGSSYYAASAITREECEEYGDQAEPTHRVTWEITNPEAEDESDTCDWSDYTVYAS